MHKVFPATKLYKTTRAQDPRTGQWGPDVNEYEHFFIQDDHEEVISAAVGRRFGFWTFSYLAKLTNQEPIWAAVFFNDIIQDSDAAMAARGELRPQLRFVPYGSAEFGMKNPPLGALEVKSKEALRLSSGRHPAFTAAWKALEDCSEHANWVALVDLGKSR